MIKNVMALLCGIWSLGLGARMTLELLLSDGWVCISKYAGYGVNVWFDFLPLCVFGLITTILEVKELIIKVRNKNAISIFI